MNALPALFLFRAETGTRTRDLFITNELLYQLSYFGNPLFRVAKLHPFYEYTNEPINFFTLYS